MFGPVLNSEARQKLFDKLGSGADEAANFQARFVQTNSLRAGVVAESWIAMLADWAARSWVSAKGNTAKLYHLM